MDNRNGIDQVHPQLCIANITAARTHGMDEFDAVVTVCQESIDDHIPEDVDYHFFNMSDGKSGYGGRYDYDFFEEAADTILRHLEADDTVLVHCHRGASRSASTSIAALGAFEDIGYHEMYGNIKDSRPQIFPDEILADHAKKYIEKQTGVGETERLK